MTEILLLHHALGRTAGVLGFADLLRRAGHAVHVPDLFHGRMFGTIEALVYAGFSLGVLPAQKLTQTRPGARGALLLSAFVYPGDQHYFADPTLPSYDAAAAELLSERVLDFLASRPSRRSPTWA